MSKKLTYFVWVIFTVLHSSLYAQKIFPDSLKLKSDNLKTIYLNRLAKNQIDLDSSLFYTHKAIVFANKCECDSLLSLSLYNLSFYPAIYGKFDLSIKNISGLDSLLQIKPNHYFLFRKNTLLAYAYKMKDQLDMALEYYKKALSESIKTKDSLIIADAYNNLGDSFISMELRKEARKYFLKALHIFEKKEGNNNRKFIIYNNLSRTASNTTEALYYSDKAFSIVLKENNPQKLALFYLSRGDALKLLDNYELSKKAFSKALQISENIHFDLVKNIALIYLGEVYLKLGNTKNAIKNLESARKLEQPNLENYKNLLQNLSQAYAITNNYKKAFDLSKEMGKINDSIFRLKSAKEFAAFDVKYNSELKDKEIAKQHLQIAKQKLNNNIYIIVSILLFSIAVLFFQRRISKQKRNRLLTDLQLQKEKEINEMRTKILGNIAHEIRTPLTLILGNLELALENIDSKEKLLQYTKIAFSNSKKVIENANEILELLKFNKNVIKLNPSIINLNNSIRRIFYSFQSLADLKKIQLDYQSSLEADYLCSMDIEKLEKILNNLMSNAIKFSNSNTKIILSSKIKGNKLYVDLIDFGQGIHFGEVDKIFERFYQASNTESVGGVGIGLALAKEYALLMGGSLGVKSKLNKGSTFTLYLPIKNQGTSKIHKRSDNSIPSITSPDLLTVNKHKPTILIVEDNPDMSNYIEEILSYKYNCNKVFDGQEALDKLNNQNFDLITSDIMMPFIDGFKLRQKLNENSKFRDIPFIMITAKSLTEDKIKGFKLGIDDYIIKPFNKNELIARIDNLLINKKARQEWHIENKDLLENGESFDKQLISKIEKIVIKNLSNENFKVTQLAKEIGYSQRQLTRILKQFTGMSPIKFILEIRLQKAYQLLNNKIYLTLSEVRYDIGILSSNYFNKSFKKRFGLMPADLQKNNILEI